MGKKNAFLEKQRAANRSYFIAGQQTGRQQIMDMMTLVLRDAGIMGRDIFGRERLLKIIQGIGDYLDKYALAWQMHDETDYYRAKLDAALSEAYGEKLHDTFMQRYEYASEFDYKKGRWA